MLGALVQSAFTNEAMRVSAPPEERVRPADLMEKYCGGSDAAFRELYALTAPRLLAYLVCLARDRTTAEEVLQLTFIKLHQSRASYVRGADPMPWLFTIAHRTFLDEARRRRRSRVEPARGELPDVAATFEEDDAPYSEEQIAEVLAAMQHLPENQRDALVLTKIQGKSVAEAAAILGTTPGAIKLRAHRGYVTLRELLRSSPEGER